MYLLETSFDLPCAHKLTLPYKSRCENVHGHTYKFVIRISARSLNDEGMVLDFHEIKHLVLNSFIDDHDHCMLNDKLHGNPTTENLAKYTYDYLIRFFEHQVRIKLHSVTVWESPTNACTYQP